ncbi:tetratricopeptide repeat protein [Spirosoma telluris]|uniref:tetratricopeptide repeat protein n=1 Tax=Spirosoma telluris TaxID=2183553 RepID=UPI002FC3945D
MDTNRGVIGAGYYPRDNEDLKLLAKRKITNFSDLLNTLTFEDLTETERKDIIANSYDTKKQVRLFYNPDVIIEDDIQPDRPIDQAIDLKAEKYFANLDLFYTKAPEQTIKFSDIIVSNAKERNYTYLKVYYTQLFKGKHSQSAVAYRPITRVAEVRVERVGKKWAGYIAHVGFLAPGDSTTSTLNDVTLVAPEAPTDSLSIRTRQEQEELVKAQRDQEVEKERKAKEVYDKLIHEGDLFLSAKNYPDALRKYNEANNNNEPGDLTAARKIAQVNRAMYAARIAEAELIRDAREKGEIARKRRNYAEALSYFHQILDKRPDSTALQTIIKELTLKSNQKTEYDEQFAAGQYEKLVDAYKKAIKTDETNSDWYLGLAKCYLKLNDDKRALTNLDLSLKFDYANLDALLVRADLHRKQGNLPKAITDQSAYLIIDPKNDIVFAQRAQLRVGTNNLANADEDFTQAIKINEKQLGPGKQAAAAKQATYYYDRGMLRYRTHQDSLAILDFTDAIKFAPAKPEAYFWRGLVNAQGKQYDKTGKDFQDAIKRMIPAPYIPRIDSVVVSLYTLGQQANEAKNYEQAIEHLKNALAVRAELPNALYERGLAYQNLGAYDKAIEDLTASIKYAPNEGATYDRRAMAYMGLNQFDKAAADYRRAYTLSPTNYAAYLGEATALLELKKYKEAIPPLMTIKTVQKKIEKNYTPIFFRDAFYRLGITEYATEQFDKAIDDYSSALKFDKTYGEVYIARGLAYEELKQFGNAIEDYQKAIDLNPTSPDRYFAKAMAQEKKKDFAPAIATYTDVIRLDSTQQLYYKRVLLRRGITYRLNEQYTEALADLKQPALEKDSDVCSYDCWLNIGLAHLYAGQPDEGIPYLAKCLKKAPFSAWAAYATGCANLQKNNDAEALVWFDKAFQEKILTPDDINKDKLIEISRKGFRKSNKDFKELVKKIGK